MDLATLKNKTFPFYAARENGRYNHFYKNICASLCSLVGRKEADFSKITVVISGEVDLTQDAHFYDGQLCGFYDFEKEELSGSYIYNSFLQTQVCFPYAPESYHSKKGLFVTLEVID